MKNLVLITQVGISLITPILLGLFLGSLVDKWVGTKLFFSIVIMLMGIAAGFINTYKLIMKLNPKKEGLKKDERHK